MPRNVDATAPPATGAPVEVVIHAGDRAPLMPLLRLADDSERAIADGIPILDRVWLDHAC